MNKDKIRAIIAQQTRTRLERLGMENPIPDVFEASNRTNSIKYITKDGRIRLDIDFDTFKELFEQANWNFALLELQANNDELMKATPYRVRMALDLYRLSRECQEMCELITRVRPMFDYREKPPR